MRSYSTRLETEHRLLENLSFGKEVSLKIVSLHRISVRETSVALAIVSGILATVRTNLGSSQLLYPTILAI